MIAHGSTTYEHTGSGYFLIEAAALSRIIRR